MTSIGITSNLDDDNSKEEFTTKTYEMLSTEFQELCPKVDRAYQLVTLMYNRLTLIENLSHKEARSKIINDHKHIPGFSDRNVRRYLPSNNPKVPRRVRPAWPNSIPTHNIVARKLSNVELQDKINKDRPQNSEDENLSINYNKLSNQNAELIEAIPGQTATVTANKKRGLTFRIPREKFEMLRVAMSDSNEFVCVVLNWNFEFDHAESDVIKSRI
jgi:hypothetical protein